MKLIRSLEKMQAPTPPKSKKLAGLAGTLAGIGMAAIFANPFTLSFTLPVGIASLLLLRYSGKRFADVISTEDVLNMATSRLNDYRDKLANKPRPLTDSEMGVFDRIESELSRRKLNHSK